MSGVDPVELFKRKPRLFWAYVIRTLIRQGWNPPVPNDVQAHGLLDDIRNVVEERKGIAASTGRETFGSTLELGEIEREVLELFAEGMTVEEVAKERGRSPETVKTQLFKARAKLGAKNVTHAVALAIRKGVL